MVGDEEKNSETCAKTTTLTRLNCGTGKTSSCDRFWSRGDGGFRAACRVRETDDMSRVTGSGTGRQTTKIVS